MTREDRRLAPTVGAAAVNFFGWPFTLVSLLYRLAVKKRFDQKIRRQNDTGLELKKLLTKVESVAHIGLQTITLFEFRSIFERYIGLAVAISAPDQASEVAEIFGVSGHPNPETASACLARKAVNKLNYHFAQARCDFIDAVDGLSAESRDPDMIGTLAIEIALAVDDPESVRKLRNTFFPAIDHTASHSSVDEVEQIWNTPERSHSIAN